MRCPEECDKQWRPMQGKSGWKKQKEEEEREEAGCCSNHSSLKDK